MQVDNLSWFPGHMAKTRRMITAEIKNMDAVCEILDARIPLSSRNPDVDELTAGKPRLVVLNRVDQADPGETRRWAAYFREKGYAVLEANAKGGAGTAQFAAAVRELLRDKLAAWAQRGQAGRTVRVMVLGIPNVGKSTFINKVARRKTARAEDRPGVTRSKQWVPVDSTLELLDTPGILWPRFDDPEVGKRLAFTGAEVDRAAADGKMAAILSIEGAELIGCDPGQVETAAEWGVRFLNPVWNWPNVLSGTNCRDTDRGLSPLGADFLRQLEACHICPDVSHISDPGFWDVVRLARGPVVATHSNSRALCPHRRNLTDDMFRAIRDSGGVVGLNLYRPFVGPAGTMEELVAHVEHFLSLGGEKALCLGGDLDGCEELAAGMEGIQDVPQLWQALADRGYPRQLLEDLFWNNLRRLI